MGSGLEMAGGIMMAANEEYGRKLHKLARMIRSKNAGPMWVTIDVIFRNEDDYRRALKSPVFTKGYLADLFGVDEDRIDRVIAFDPGLAIKFNLRRTEPAGSWGDEDMYGTQYYVPLVDVSV